MSAIRPVAFTLFAFALLLGIAFFPVPANAIGFQPVSPEELKMTSVPEAPGAPAVILYRQVDRDDNVLTGHEDNYVRIKILTEEGRNYANVEIPFYSEFESVTGIKGRTIRPDGSIVNFSGQVFEKTLIKEKGKGWFAKTITLPDVQVGSIIEYSYTYDFAEYYLIFSHWTVNDELFTKRAKFSLKEFNEPHSHIYFKWSWNTLPKGATEPKEELAAVGSASKNGPDRYVRMEATNIPAFETEDHMPPKDEMKSHVDFIYSEDQFEKDASVYWKTAGKRLNANLERFLGNRKAMEKAVAEIVLPGDSPEVKLQKIYARVQQLRNTSFELEKTEQEKKREKEKDASAAEDVLKRGYGNRMELTWLFLGLVRAAGLDASALRVANREEYFFSPKTMNSRRLEENVVLVKLNGKDIYCDPGAAFTPLGMLPWSETAVAGLMLEKDGGKLIQTPQSESSASRTERVAKLKLSPDGSLEGKLTITFTGLEAAKRRVEERHEDDAARKKYLENEVRQDVPGTMELELVNKPDWKGSETPLVAEFDFKVPGWATQAGRRALLPVGLFAAREKHMFEHNTRVHPIYFSYPAQEVDDITIELPSGWQVSSLPQPRSADGGKAISYSLKLENDKTSIRLARKFNIDFIYLEKQYYSALQSFFAAIKTGDAQQIVLQSGAAVASK
jgi:hypothetical protein